ncbi:MAG TPA: methylenetetrahydrofolate reductase [Trebonia sp.]|nr:methylenetetrahydrofolate reductase [Trebonia sp.]
MSTVLDDFSMEMTGKDVAKVENAASVIPPGTRINVTFLENEDLAMRVTAAAAAKRLGFTPVPHISARRLKSQEMLEEFLTALRDTGATENVFAVSGDPAVPAGPYEDSLAVIESGVLQRYGVKHVSIAGYPDGHPDIAADVLWDALEKKSAALAGLNIPGTVITQVDFDVDRVLSWVAEVRQHGVELPVRVGVPGPASVKLLLGFAGRLGISTSATIAKKYGLSVASLLGKAGPENFIRDLQAGLDPDKHGVVKLHFYTFGGFKTTAEWIANHRQDF